MNAPAVSVKVAKRFHELRRRYLGVRIGIALSMALAVLIAIWLTLSLCDSVWELPATYRAIAAVIGSCGVLVWLVARLYAVVRDTRQRKFASAVEDSFQEFGQRVRTVLETVDGRVNGPDEMLAALGHQTLGRWETLSPAQMIPKRMLLACGCIALLAVVVVTGLLGRGGDMRIAMLRALGNEIPYTQLKVTPGSSRVLEGAPIEVSLELTGRINRDVMLRYRVLADAEDADASEAEVESIENEWIESDLLPVGSDQKQQKPQQDRRARFAAGLGKAKDAVEYQFITSVATTPVYRIDVQPLIEASKIETIVQPPEYTGLENRSFTTPRVTVLERSVVSVTIETNHPLHDAKLELGKKAKSLQPTEIAQAENLTQWTFTLPTQNSIHWRFSGSGRDGTPMEPVKGRLRVRRDGAPILTFRDPPDEIKVHTLAELPMKLQISDDYGIAETGIVFQLGGDEDYVLTDWLREEDAENTTRLRLDEILPLESFELTEQDFISYYAYAVDNRDWGQQRSESDVRYIDIRPLRQYWGEIELDPANGGEPRLIVQLDEIIRRQRFIINRTRRLLNSSGVDMAKQLGTIDRLVESQSELAGLTRFLTEFLVSQGNDDVEALNQAEASMLQAADSLAAGSFDLAMVQEQDALRALAEARRSLELFLIKNPTPAQRAAMRRFSRQMRQKLRRERPETERQLADTLQRIASEQMQLSEMACALCNSPGGQNSAKSSMQGKSGQGKGSSQQQSQQGASGAPGTPSDPQQESQPANGSENQDQGDADPTAEGQQNGQPQSAGENAVAEENESPEEQLEKLYAAQTDLLERLQDIEEQLLERLSSSPLLAERMDQAKEAMDDLATRARQNDLETFERDSNDTADQVQEMGLQLEALAAGEPVSRVSSIRDMATALANMESNLAEQMNPNGSGGTSPNPSDSDQANAARRLARRLQRRSETVEDVLKAPVETGDVETSEVNAYLEKFVEETEFLEQLDQTRDAVEKFAGNGSESDEENDDTQQGGQGEDATDAESGESYMGGLERATEYASAARALDELYRQLVTPRLARLRDMEQKANQLSQQMGQGGRQDEEREPDPEAKAGMRQLQEDLEQEGLGILVEILDESEWSDEEVTRKIEEMKMTGSGATAQRSFGILGINSSANRLMLVSVELQRRIQEMILLEISADRDAPVPSQYRQAVDRYFRVIAGEAESAVSAPTGDDKSMQPVGVD